VVVEVVAPVLVALRGKQFRRADDVGEKHGAQHPLGRHRIRLLPNEFEGCPWKQLDQVCRIVFARRQFAQVGVRNPRGQLRCGFEGRDPVAPAPITKVGVRTLSSTPRTSISATACHISRAIIGLADARCSRPHISRTPGISATGPKNSSAKAPSPQWFSMSS
jgi:hypothetical protein